MVSRITGSVGKGLAAITMDKEYQQKRREEMNRPPKDFGESLAKGGKGLLKVQRLTAQIPMSVYEQMKLSNSFCLCRESSVESQASSPNLLRVIVPLLLYPNYWFQHVRSMYLQSTGGIYKCCACLDKFK